MKLPAILGVLAALTLTVPACDGGGEKNAADKKADDKKADAKADDKKAGDAKGDEKADAKADEKAADAPAGDEKAADGAGEKIGVALCDEYVEKYTKCIDTHAPEAAKKTLKDGISKKAAEWRELAAGPTKDTLEQACKGALDAVKKTSKGWGCTYE